MRILIFIVLLLTVFVSNQTFAQEAEEGKLHLVKKIHIGSMGKSDEAERFQLLLEEQLEKKGFIVVTDADKADAILTGVLSLRVYDDTSIARVTVQLKTLDGKRIWGGDFQPKRSLKRVDDTVKFRAENIAGRLRKDWNKSAKEAGIKVDK